MAKLEKRNGKYYVRVWIPDYKKYKWIPTDAGKADSVRVCKLITKEEALVRVGLKKQLDALKLDLRLDEAIDRFLKAKRNELSPGTIPSYRLSLDDLKKVCGASTRLGELNPNDYLDLIDYLRNKKQVTPTTINIRFRSIKAFLNWCIDMRYLKEMPFKIKKQAEIKGEPRVFTPDEFKRIYDLTLNPVLKAYFRLTYFTGMRRKEINGSNWIERNGRSFIQVTETKGTDKSWRLIPILYDDCKSDWELATNTQYKLDRLSRGFTEVAKLAGCYVKFKKTFHGLRHSFGEQWIGDGKSIAILKKVMGHSNIATTIDFYSDAEIDYYGEKALS